MKNLVGDTLTQNSADWYLGEMKKHVYIQGHFMGRDLAGMIYAMPPSSAKYVF